MYSKLSLIAVLAVMYQVPALAQATAPACEGALAETVQVEPVPAHAPSAQEQEVAAEKRRRENIERLNETLAVRKRPVNEAVYKEAEKALSPFARYSASLKKAVIEGDNLIDAFMRALIGKGHVLIMGSAGVAKSLAADLTLKNIVFGKKYSEKGVQLQNPEKAVDLTSSTETKTTADHAVSVFDIMFDFETTKADIFGSLNTGELLKDGSRARRYDQGIASYVYAFLDEFFDAPAQAIRMLLKLMNEREVRESGKTLKALTQSVFAATNYYLPEAYRKAREKGIKLEANIDRFSYIIFGPKEFSKDPNPLADEGTDERMGSDLRMIRAALDQEDHEISQLDYEDLARLQALTKEVEVPDEVIHMTVALMKTLNQKLLTRQLAAQQEFEQREAANESPPPPYRMTKLFTKRMRVKAAKELRTIVVLDWIRKGGKRELVANFDDILALKPFLTQVGPKGADLDKLVEDSAFDPEEKSALETIKIEQEAFNDAWKEITTDYDVEASIVFGGEADLPDDPPEQSAAE